MVGFLKGQIIYHLTQTFTFMITGDKGLMADTLVKVCSPWRQQLCHWAVIKGITHLDFLTEEFALIADKEFASQW